MKYSVSAIIRGVVDANYSSANQAGATTSHAEAFTSLQFLTSKGYIHVRIFEKKKCVKSRLLKRQLFKCQLF